MLVTFPYSNCRWDIPLFGHRSLFSQRMISHVTLVIFSNIYEIPLLSDMFPNVLTQIGIILSYNPYVISRGILIYSEFPLRLRFFPRAYEIWQLFRLITTVPYAVIWYVHFAFLRAGIIPSCTNLGLIESLSTAIESCLLNEAFCTLTWLFLGPDSLAGRDLRSDLAFIKFFIRDVRILIINNGKGEIRGTLILSNSVKSRLL